MDASAKEVLKEKLEQRFLELNEQLKKLEGFTTSALPANSREAENMKEEIERVEGEEEILSAELENVRKALARIDSEVFGSCSGCGKDIPFKRLEALPHAELCVDCQEKKENHA